jgi:phage recombination protein Bet
VASGLWHRGGRVSALAAVSDIRGSIDLVKRTVAKGATDEELELFIRQCERTGLDPFARQIYAIKRWDAQVRAEVMQTQVSIDGLRTLAAETEQMGGQIGPYWCGADGAWRDVWLESQPPRAAKVSVLRITGASEAAQFTGVALFDSYCQRKKDGTATRMWAQMAPEMLAKCAEALALRKAFPMQMSGLYTNDEMAQASNPTPSAPESPPHAPETAPAALPPPIPPSAPAMPTGSPTDAMRARVAAAIGGLEPSQRSAALELADNERLPLTDEVSFTPAHANRWLEIVREVQR